MLKGHFDTLAQERTDELVSALETAVAAQAKDDIVRIMRTPSFPGSLRAAVGWGKEGRQLELRQLFVAALDIAELEAGPEAWLFLAAAVPYRDFDVTGMVIMNTKAVKAATDEERPLVDLIGSHNFAALLANIRKYRMNELECFNALGVNAGVVALLEGKLSYLCVHESARKLLEKARYGTTIHGQWSNVPEDHAAAYIAEEERGRALGQWDVVTAALRERAKIRAAEGNTAEARELLTEAIEVAEGHGYAWHVTKAQEVLATLPADDS